MCILKVLAKKIVTCSIPSANLNRNADDGSTNRAQVNKRLIKVKKQGNYSNIFYSFLLFAFKLFEGNAGRCVDINTIRIVFWMILDESLKQTTALCADRAAVQP